MMTQIDWTWFRSQLKTWTKWQLMGKDLIYRQDLADDLLDDLDRQQWKLVRRELKKRGYKYHKSKWIRKGK
jgi:hypothetical protein